MKLKDFIGKYGPQLSETIDSTVRPIYNPLKPEGVSHYEGKIKNLLRKPFRVQEEVIKGMSKALYEESLRHLFLVGEQGSGKTFLSLSIVAMSSRPLRVLVVCPTHLVEKWKREASNTLDCTVTDLNKRNVITVLEGFRGKREKPARPEVYIISKERCKLGYGWVPAYNLRKNKTIPQCPSCGEKPKNKEDIYLTTKDLSSRKHFCRKCGSALWQADNKLRRYPPAEYIKKYLKGYFDMLILDEIQDYKAGGTLQGVAMGNLVSSVRMSMSLTGTLNGGYADDIFYLLYRTAPEEIKKDGFLYGEATKWVETFGTLERVQPIEEKNNYYGRGKRKTAIVRKRPGVSPLVVGKYLLGRSCFIRLADIIDGLPPYEENVVAVRMSEAQKNEYAAFSEELKDCVKKYRMKVMSSMLQALLSYPDSCVAFPEEIVIEVEGEVKEVIEAPQIVADEPLPKEQELINLVKREKALGRKVLCYLTFTNTRDIRPRLKEVLKDFRVGVLDASVNPLKREAWIEKHAKDIDVLLVNAELVKTGLDLYDFPTVVFYQVGYNIFTLRQAARRSWRIGQTKPVKVYFFCYQGTMQEAALSLIAKKLETALLVEGDLPEGLAEYTADGYGNLTEEMAQVLTGEKGYTSAERAWAAFRKKEMEVQLGLKESQCTFSEAAKTGKPGTFTTVSDDVVVKVSIIDTKKKKQSTVEVEYGNLDSVLDGRVAQFAMF